jgi:branched-chain amino acid transport system ATP-binding protein/sulfate-transporting ATPase
MSMDVILAVVKLTKRFGGLAALSELTLNIERGKVMGLIGPNGSGKTTFFNVVSGLFAPTSGNVVFDEANIAGLPPQDVHARGIARTFQRSRLLLPLSIFDNIALGRHLRQSRGLWPNLFHRARVRAEIRDCYEQARELLAIFDPDLARDMTRPVEGLPMISRRRVEICRALVSDPKLLLLDEPSAGMTHDETMRLVDDILLVKKRSAELGIVIIEHEMSVMERITDTCAVMNFGTLVCAGPYHEVSRDPRVQEAYLGGE